MSEIGPHATDWTAPPLNWSQTVLRRHERLSSRLPRLFRSGLDVLITHYAIGLCLIGLTGGLDLGVVRMHEAAKPLFVLFLIVPLRIALGGSSWLADVMHITVPRVTGWWELARARVPAAVSDTLFAFVVVRIASLPAAFVANVVFEPARERGLTLPFRYETFAEIFAAWDSGWYWDIARRGYFFSPDAQSSIAFFPLYPVFMHAVAAPFGGGDSATWIAGIVISLSACALRLIALHRFTERIFGSREVARCTVLLVAVFPWSLFLTRVYAESLFLLMSVLAVSRRFWKRCPQEYRLSPRTVAHFRKVLGDAGILVDPDDVNGFAQAIHRTLTDEAFAIACAERGLARARQFSWDRAAIALHRAYEAAFANRCRAQYV